MKPYDELTLSDDFMFCLVMQDKELCIELLERILDIKIKDISYQTDQKEFKFSYGGKSIRLDVYVEGDDTVYDIEMQATSTPGLPKRSRYYQSMVDMNLLEKSERYSSIKDSKIIFICTFDPFGMGKSLYDFKFLDINTPSLELGDGCERIFLNTKGTGVGISEDLHKLLNYIDNGLANDYYSSRIEERIKDIKQRSEGRPEYMTWEMKMQEYGDERASKAHAEGLAEGLAEGQANTLKVLIEKGLITKQDAVNQFGISSNDLK